MKKKSVFKEKRDFNNDVFSFDRSFPRYSYAIQFAAYLGNNNAILGGVILLAYFASPISVADYKKIVGASVFAYTLYLSEVMYTDYGTVVGLSSILHFLPRC